MSADDCADLKEGARGLEYWGQVAVEVTIRATVFATTVFPKDGHYLVPLKKAVRDAEGGIGFGDTVEATVVLTQRGGLR